MAGPGVEDGAHSVPWAKGYILSGGGRASVCTLTLAIMPAHRLTSHGGARSVPIHLTTSYVFDDDTERRGLFGLARAPSIYRGCPTAVAGTGGRISMGEVAVATSIRASCDPPRHRHAHGNG